MFGEILIMRVHEGNFAYDIEQERDLRTQLLSGWRFTVYRVHPVETVLTRGQAPTREAAEAEAKQIISKLEQNPEWAA